MSYTSRIKACEVVSNADAIKQAADKLTNKFSSEINELMDHYKKNTALLERFDLTLNSAYQTLLDEIEKQLAVKIKMWKKVKF